ncbi:Uncharacterized protein Adt_19559 [Abeliophyllum distichum]|uniref:CCHC-type domain-containing protein n=1 Tax=Abeliophyllum distichum TaxID=126358 RepID=A0ABD1SUD2_9LAMI
MATDSITEVVATENQTMATMQSPSVNQTMAQVPSFAVTQTMAPTSHVSVPVNHGEKSEKFNRLNFKRWQQKMLFYLTTLNLARFLIDDASKLKQEHGQNSKTNKNKFGKGPKVGPKGGVSNKKFLRKCYNCDGVGHRSSECTLPKRNNKKEANVVDDITHDVSEMNFTAVISEVNLVGSNPKEWWIDISAIHHVCSDKEIFNSFEATENGEKLFMKNSATSEIKGQDKVVLKMTSRKELTLNNVLFVPEICKKLVSGSLLNKHSFYMVFESDKVILSKSRMFVGKSYVSDGFFKLNVMTVKPKINKINNSFTYLLESSNLWHGRL